MKKIKLNVPRPETAAIAGDVLEQIQPPAGDVGRRAPTLINSPNQ
jgi:hypothetical protein